jgi:anti-anti-sigma factor
LTKTEPGSAQLEIVLIDRTMILRGEIDISNYDVLADAGRKLAARCTDRLGEAVIDAAGLSFIDAGGLDTLVSLSSSLSSVGSRLRIIHASGPLRRVSGICGLDATLGLESTGSRPHLDRASTS